MRFVTVAQALLALLLLSSTTYPQQVTSGSAPHRDPQTLAVLAQALNAAGGLTALTVIQDFAASGTITYFWAGEDVKGSVKVRGRGLDQFRLDASLPQGLRSWAVNNGSGVLKEIDGTNHSIRYHNAVNLGSLTLPFVAIAAPLQDSTVSVSGLALVDADGRKALQVRVQRNFDSTTDPDGTLTRLSARDFFFDPNTFQLLKIQQMTHPSETFTEDYAQEILFSDYRLVNGISVPFAITERIAGQRTWTIQLDLISFNQSLSDADFQL